MDAGTGGCWENEDGSISIVKTEIEECEPAYQDAGENEDHGNFNDPYAEDGTHFGECFMPKQENYENFVPKQEFNENEEHFGAGQGENYYVNSFQETSSSMGEIDNWPLLQGFTTPEADQHFMNQPGTSDINEFADKREAMLYPCKYCDYVGSHPKLLNSHMNNRHIKAVVYQCPHCAYNSTLPRSVREHIQCKHVNESDDKLIVKRSCQFCEYSASSATALKNHMNKHTKEVKHQCNFCEFNTLWEGYLKMHIRRKHSDQSTEFGNAKEYPCQYCDYKAATPSTLKLHTNKHTREQEHQCPYCPYKTVWTTYIKLHIQNKHFKGDKTPPSKEHPCSFCDYKAKNSTLLRQHMNKHTREKVHQCPHCPFNTLWVTYMKLHIKRKHTENNENDVAEKKDFQCQYCTYKAISLSHLKIHENKHTKAIEYKCNQCDFKTTWYGYLKFHIKRKHSSGVKEEDEKTKMTFPCKFCPYKAINLSTLKVHQNKHTRENIYNCPHCEFKTTWRAYIKSHIQRHNANNFKTRKQGDGSVKSYPCQYCSYVATQMGSLKLHVNSKHTRENMHKCPECDYQCAVYGNLRMHIRRKHGLKPDENGIYHCKECEFNSESAIEIKSHLQEKHDLKIEVDDVKKEDEKVYSCQYCSYTTLYQQVMKKHINKHTRQNVIQCPHCPYSTVWNHYMKVHIKRHNEPKTLTGRQRLTKPNTDQSRLFPCQYCDHRSLSFSSLRDHINSVHTRAVIHKCPYCDHKCTLKGNLKGHIRRKHPAEFVEQEKRYQCEHCEFKTSERRIMKIHMKKEHNIDEAKERAENGEYQCQFCDYKAKSLYTLKIHRHKHTKENAYRCPQCEFATKWPNYLRKHIKQHSIGKSRVSCLYCEYKGCSTFRLRKHIESLHKIEEYYPCPKPNCLFRTIHYTSLRMHLKGSIHAVGVRRGPMSVSRNFSYKYRPNEGRYFACDYCEYASKTQGNLDKHIENKHEKKGMKCGLCSYRTPSKNYLARHYKLRHYVEKKEDNEVITKVEEADTTNPEEILENIQAEESEIVKAEELPEISPALPDYHDPDISEPLEISSELETNEEAPNANEESDATPGLRSRRKRSFVPYYVEDSDEEENEFMCEDFLEVQLGANTGPADKQNESESNKEHEAEPHVFIEPKIEITELEPSEELSSTIADSSVHESNPIPSVENKSQADDETIIPNQIITRRYSTRRNVPVQPKMINPVNGVSGKNKISNTSKTIKIAKKVGDKMMNGKRKIVVKKVVAKKINTGNENSNSNKIHPEISKETAECPQESADGAQETVDGPQESVDVPQESAKGPQESVEGPQEPIHAAANSSSENPDIMKNESLTNMEENSKSAEKARKYISNNETKEKIESENSQTNFDNSIPSESCIDVNNKSSGSISKSPDKIQSEEGRSVSSNITTPKEGEADKEKVK